MVLGKTQELVITHFTDAGAYLAETVEDRNSVLLPNRSVPEGAKAGDRVSVFLYKDSEDRLIATTAKPALEVGGLALLTVKEVTKIGAFLSWGLAKDLLLPYKEMRGELKAGQKVFVTLYVDHSGRLAASMFVDRFFRSDPPYKADDKVSGRVYALNKDIGAFVAVDDRYFGLIPRQELYEKLTIGQEVQARVVRVRPDGKLNLSIRKKAYAQMKTDEEKVLEHLDMAGGILGLGDKSDPVLIQAELGLSKNAYKRAIGAIYKAGKIRISDESIERV